MWCLRRFHFILCKTHVRALLAVVIACLVGILAASWARGDADDEPAGYRTLPVNDPVSRLQAQLDRGQTKLEYHAKSGYLKSVLAQLKLPESSQSLVFSKTSFQRAFINPHRPRALYFNDDVYVGFVPKAPLLEIASVDPKLGTIFYTLDQQKTARPHFVRQTDDCLQCHQSGVTKDVPGLLMRSVYPDMEGQPILSAGTYSTTDQTPLSHRWGGWYVTGDCGRQVHMGNTICDDEDHPEQTDFSAGSNLINLRKHVKTAPYPRDTSDIVALMVFQHQQHLHNLITHAGYDVRLAIRDSEALDRALGEPPGQRSESTQHRIQSDCEPVVKAMLFSGEARLIDPVTGSSGFTQEFAARGPKDSKGRSLREFDLKHRLFKYPCSYLIYSEQFDALPPDARDYIYRRLWEVLTSRDTGRAFAHLTASDRAAILQILRETKKGLPGDWH